jgi:uncharacterized protein (TIGR02001 family)
MMRAGCFGALICVAVTPAYAASDVALSGNAALLTQYVDRGITNSAERPAAQVEFDLYYKEIYYAGIWGSNVDFGAAPTGQELANIELDYYVGVAPTVGKWNFDVAAYYIAYPGAFDRDGEFSYVEIWTGVSRSFFDDRLELTLYNYWCPNIRARPARSHYRMDVRQGLVFHTETQRQVRPAMGRCEPGRLRLYLLERRLDVRLQCEAPPRVRDSLLG